MGLVMQEPTLFNYNITENILYGKMDATNTEIREAASIANALEFIEGQESGLSQLEEVKAEQLLIEMTKNREVLLGILGDKKYDAMLKEIRRIKKKES